MKKITLFKIKEFNTLDEDIEKLLKKNEIRNLSGNEECIFGFCKNKKGSFHIKIDEMTILNIESRSRSVPKSTLDRCLSRKLIELSEENPNEWSKEKITKNKINELKETLKKDLLKKAFTKYNNHVCIINKTKSIVLIDSTSNKVNDNVLNLIRTSLGSFPVARLESPNITEQFMSWISGDITNENFQVIDGDITLKEKNGSVAKYLSQDVKSDEITLNLQSSKVPIEISLKWRDEFQFNVNNEIKISKIKNIGKMKTMVNQANDKSDEDKDTSSYIFYIECFKMISDLMNFVKFKEKIDDTNTENKNVKTFIEGWDVN